MKLLLAYLPLGLWAAGVLTVGALELSGHSFPSGWDKAAHFVMYGVGGALAAWTGYRRGHREGIVALVIVFVTGIVDEVHQSTLATRHGDPLDWTADAAGAGFFYLAVGRLLRKGIDQE